MKRTNELMHCSVVNYVPKIKVRYRGSMYEYDEFLKYLGENFRKKIYKSTRNSLIFMSDQNVLSKKFAN